MAIRGPGGKKIEPAEINSDTMGRLPPNAFADATAANLIQGGNIAPADAAAIDQAAVDLEEVDVSEVEEASEAEGPATPDEPVV